MVDKCRAALSAAGIGSAAFTETEGNPSTETVEKAVDAYKSSGADFIVAFGGGSPLDVAKAASILVTYGGKITEYEGGGKVPGPVVPMIAIPTTAGTGSEVTSFSVITDHSRNYKLSVSSNYLLPAYAILDPELIASVRRERLRHAAWTPWCMRWRRIFLWRRLRFRYVRAESPSADREKSPRLRGEPRE